MAEINKELEAIRLEKERLELEISRAQVEKLRNEKETRARHRGMVEADLKAARDGEAQRQAQCNHLKGGLGVEGIRGRGNDGGNYAVNKQTLPDGTVYVMCLRCMKEWHPKDKDYAQAMQWPTDNVPSMSVTFTVSKSA